MRASRSLLFLLVLGSLLLISGEVSCAVDRPPAVAGQFYPSSATDLRSMLAEFFSHATLLKDLGPVQALVVPHAGYVYSGQVAAAGFVQLDPQREIQNVFVIGVSHHEAFEGAAVFVSGSFVTPLGRVPVNTEIGRSLLGNEALFMENDRAHAVEHSLEVQIPFLQYRMKKPFKLVPILLGTAEPGVCKRLAQVLQKYFTEDNVFIFSTDLSHYPAYEEAVSIDKRTIDAVVSGSADELLRTVAANERMGSRELLTSMCGLGGVLVLQDITGSSVEFRRSLVLYKNSADVPIGDRKRVVGYAAVAVTRPLKESFSISPDDRRQLLTIARSTVVEYLRTHHTPDLATDRFSSTLRTPCGAFVTLKKHGDLRGCIGNFSGSEALATTVQKMAIAAATEDYRFPPVSRQELDGLDIEISVLSPMRRIGSSQEIQLGKHGIYIRKGGRSGTFLPQVAAETGWSLEDFLGHCAHDKAGIGWDGWKDAELYVYEAIVFGEQNDGNGR
jgi:MEMO1 family protein